jgi:hypothetical protein
VTLRIAPATLVDVRVTTAAAPAARSRIELEQVQATNLRLGDGEIAFNGSIGITRTVLTDTQIVAEELLLESVDVVGGLVQADVLTGIDSKLDATVLDAGQAVLSACRLQDMQVRRCGALTLIASDIERSLLGPCQEQPLRVYSSTVLLSLADGRIESDRSRWEASRFGSRGATDLLMWDRLIMSSSFCAGTRTARFGASADVQCSKCDAGLQTADAVCIEPGFESELGATACPAFEAPPVCADPDVRQRPLNDEL